MGNTGRMKSPDWKPRDTDRARALRHQATPAERALWAQLARRGLGAKFSRQMPVGPFFADFLCRELKLVIGLDGFSHDVEPQRDAARDLWMKREGFTVLRFANTEVHGHLEGVITAIREVIAQLRLLAHP